jgi:hypothetical protein
MEAHGDQLSGSGDARLKWTQFGKVDYDQSWREAAGGGGKRDNRHGFIQHLGVFLALALFGFW